DAIFRTGNAGDGQVLHDQRRTGNNLALVGIGDVTLPDDLAGLLVGRDQPAVHGVGNDEAAPKCNASIVDAATSDSARPVAVRLRIHLPDEAPAAAVRVDLVDR